jgi:signal transduction histidine kinase
MGSSRSSTPDLPAQGRAVIDGLLQQSEDVAERAGLLAEALHGLWSAAPVCAALLRDKSNRHVAACDVSGQRRPEWAESLSVVMRESNAEGLSLPPALDVAAGVVARVPLLLEATDYGTLIVALPRRTSRSAADEARTALTACANHLALRLHLESLERAGRSLREEWKELTWLANVGELTSVVAHEINNYLNVVGLNVAVLEHKLPEENRPELREVRRQGAAINVLVKQLQQYRRDRPAELRRLDFNRIVHEAAEELGHGQTKHTWCVVIQETGAETAGQDQGIVPLRLDLMPGLPSVEAVPSDLRRLVSFLLGNAGAAAAMVGGEVTARTEVAAGNVVLTIADAGPPVSAEALARFFEAGHAGREGTNSLELAACKSIVRRLKGTIQAEARPEGGVAMTVAIPMAAPG